jgi:phosphoadenosine phosphosulfate reductase
MKGIPADKLIQNSVNHYQDRLAIACSFGKDSVTVLHMALKHDPDIKVVFSNTGIEFPETIKYKEQLAQQWGLNLHEAYHEPGTTFWTLIKKHGLPQIRGKGKHRTPPCCTHLKEKPALAKYRELGVKAILTGITAAESRQRALLIARYDNNPDTKICGQRYYSTSQDLYKIHPIAHWQPEDVWQYIHQNKIPINPVYQKWGGIYNRVGCLPCTAYRDWDKKLPKTHPKLYQKLMSHSPQTLLKTKEKKIDDNHNRKNIDSNRNRNPIQPESYRTMPISKKTSPIPIRLGEPR